MGTFEEAVKMPIKILALIREENKRANNVPYEESDKIASEAMKKIFHEFELMPDIMLQIENELLIKAIVEGVDEKNEV